MNVLSLFDGISCGQVAFDRLGVTFYKLSADDGHSNVERESNHYFASEINPIAIKCAMKNYPNTIEIGDVTKIHYKNDKLYKNCKLDENNNLILGEEIPNSHIDILIGGSPCQSLSSSNVYLKDGEYGVNGDGKSKLFWEYVKMLLIVKPKYFLFENVASMKNVDKDIITKALGVNPIKINSSQFSPQNRRRLYWTNIPFNIEDKRYTNITMQDILETTVDDKYYVKEGTKKCIMSPAKNGWQSGKMEINLKIGRPITASCWRMHRADTDNYISTEYCPIGRTNIRRLTPLEAERMQTLPDNYTIGEKDKDRYEAIGNGWTVDVISHILSYLPKEFLSNKLEQ